MDLNQDCSFGFVNLKGSDFQKLLSDLVHIIQTHNEEYIKDTQAAFKQFMRDYERIGIDYAAISRPKLKIRSKVFVICGCAMKNRVPQISNFYDLLKERAAIQGKWSSVNAAVRDILPELKHRFLEYDRQQIISKIEENKNILRQMISCLFMVLIRILNITNVTMCKNSKVNCLKKTVSWDICFSQKICHMP